jgi:hypothetical protein
MDNRLYIMEEPFTEGQRIAYNMVVSNLMIVEKLEELINLQKKETKSEEVKIKKTTSKK